MVAVTVRAHLTLLALAYQFAVHSWNAIMAFNWKKKQATHSDIGFHSRNRLVWNSSNNQIHNSQQIESIRNNIIYK